MTRAVVDTNVVIRAIIKPQGGVGPVLGRLRAGDYEVILSRLLLDEVADVLGRVSRSFAQPGFWRCLTRLRRLSDWEPDDR